LAKIETDDRLVLGDQDVNAVVEHGSLPLDALSFEVMPQIRIPPVLRSEAAGNRTITVEAVTVRDALGALVSEYPALRDRVFAGEAVPTFLNVFVDGEDVRLGAGLDTELGESSLVLLLPAVAGG
jgi:molybdopterin converting factor small subunit